MNTAWAVLIQQHPVVPPSLSNPTLIATELGFSVAIDFLPGSFKIVQWYRRSTPATVSSSDWIVARHPPTSTTNSVLTPTTRPPPLSSKVISLLAPLKTTCEKLQSDQTSIGALQIALLSVPESPCGAPPCSKNRSLYVLLDTIIEGSLPLAV